MPGSDPPPAWFRIIASLVSQGLGWCIGFAGYWAYMVFYLPWRRSHEPREALGAEVHEKLVSLGWTKGYAKGAGREPARAIQGKRCPA